MSRGIDPALHTPEMNVTLCFSLRFVGLRGFMPSLRLALKKCLTNECSTSFMSFIICIDNKVNQRILWRIISIYSLTLRK